MKSKAQALFEKLEKLTEQREQDKARIENEISLCTEEITRLEEEAHALERCAVSEKNFEKYQSAKIALEEAQDKRELYEKHYLSLKTAPVLSPEEMEKEKAALLSEIEANSRARRTRAAAIITELEKLAEEDRTEIMNGNGVLLTMEGNHSSFYSDYILPQFIDELHRRTKEEYKALIGQDAPKQNYLIYNKGSFVKKPSF